MRLASLNDGTADGRLLVVTRDNLRCARARAAKTLQAALEDWARIAPLLSSEAAVLEAEAGDIFDAKNMAAPLPRAWQWLDGSTFQTHIDLVETAYGLRIPDTGMPLMYQGLSHQFLAPMVDLALPSEAHDIDFEGEFGVVVDHVPMGTTADEASRLIRLVVQINDWSLRAFGPAEMRSGFGFVHTKPACAMAPVAVTPDELGHAWRDGRVALPLRIERSGDLFGNANGYPMRFSFPELIAHAAFTRSLCAGTLIGSGTVANDTYRNVGSSCIAEQRAIEIIDHGAPSTGFLRFGERVRMECRGPAGEPLFGAIDQIVRRCGIAHGAQEEL